MTDFDIAICGGGPVGLLLAAMLAMRGMPPERVAVIDAKTVEQSMRDPRSIALSYGSRQILEGVHAWPVAAQAIEEIHVSRRRHFGRTLIDCKEYGLPALGYVARYGTLVSALAAITERQGITMLRPAQLHAAIEQSGHVELTFDDGTARTAQIMVQAEGGVFGEQAGKTLKRDYAQTAVIAQVDASHPLPHRAFERFTDEGPLALLPQENGYALVWCTSPDRAQRLLSLGDAAFLAELQEAFGTRLGRFVRVASRAAYPLGLNAQPAQSKRSVAIGNAAQTLHPVAGQGLNLGLRDAAVLARLLAQETSPAMLEHFLLSRKEDRNVAIRLTDAMARLFSSTPDGSWQQSLLGLSLGLLDAFSPAKRLLAEQMMFGRR